MTGAAPPPSDSPQGRTWGSASSGDGEAEYADLGRRNPDRLGEPGLGGTTEHNYPLGCKAATGTAASAVDSQLPEAQGGAHRRETSGRFTHLPGLTARRRPTFDTHVNRQILRDYSVDHATAGKVPGLKSYLADSKIVKFMHSHRNDARILRAYGIRLQSVLDTALCDALSRGKALHQGRNLGEALKDTLGVELPHKATMPRDERGIFRKRPAAPQTIEYCAQDVLYSAALGMEQRSRILQAAGGSDVLDIAYAASNRCSDSSMGRASMFHLYVADARGILMRPATADDPMLPVHMSEGTGGRAVAASMLKELVVRVKNAASGAAARVSQAVVVKHTNDGVGVVRWSAGGPGNGPAREGSAVQPDAGPAPRWVPWKLALGDETLPPPHRNNLLLVAQRLLHEGEH